MIDQRVRELERRWRTSRTVEDEGAWLYARAHAGADPSVDQLRAAAILGDPAATVALRSSRAIATLDGAEARFRALAPAPASLLQRAVVAALRVRIDAMEASVPGSRRSVEALERWIVCPCVGHRDALARLGGALPHDSSGWIATLVPDQPERALSHARALGLVPPDQLIEAVGADVAPWLLGRVDPLLARVDCAPAHRSLLVPPTEIALAIADDDPGTEGAEQLARAADHALAVLDGLEHDAPDEVTTSDHRELIAWRALDRRDVIARTVEAVRARVGEPWRRTRARTLRRATEDGRVELRLGERGDGEGGSIVSARIVLVSRTLASWQRARNRTPANGVVLDEPIVDGMRVHRPEVHRDFIDEVAAALDRVWDELEELSRPATAAAAVPSLDVDAEVRPATAWREAARRIENDLH